MSELTRVHLFIRDSIPTAEHPYLVTYIHRYSKPEDMAGFYCLTPTNDHHWNIQPFAPSRQTLVGPWDDDGSVPGFATYREMAPELTNWDTRRELFGKLANKGFRPFALDEIPVNLRHYVIHSQCPLEWQKGLDENQSDLMSRVMVWMLGKFPETEECTDRECLEHRTHWFCRECNLAHHTPLGLEKHGTDTGHEALHADHES